jgi:hypothetical protein
VHQVGCKISILYHDARSKIHQKILHDLYLEDGTEEAAISYGRQARKQYISSHSLTTVKNFTQENAVDLQPHVATTIGAKHTDPVKNMGSLHEKLSLLAATYFLKQT